MEINKSLSLNGHHLTPVDTGKDNFHDLIFVLTKERFPDEGELIAFLKDVQDDLNDLNRGEILGLVLIVVAVSAHKKLKRKLHSPAL